MECAIEVKGLNKTFNPGLFEKPKQVLSEVSFQLPVGKTTGFIGVNGSGKTTTIKALLGFIKATSGQIHFWGKPLGVEAKMRIGYLPERPYLYEFLTVEEYLRFHWNLTAHAYKNFNDDFTSKCDEVLNKVNLLHAKKKKMRTFSKGMLQRAGLAQSILSQPDLLILDEPMSGLDPDGRWIVKEILREQKKLQKTIFFSSHLLQDMEELCDELVVIDGGRILYTGDMLLFKNKYPSLEEAFSHFRKDR